MMFGLNSTGFVVYTAYVIGLMRGALVNHQDQPLDQRLQLASQGVITLNIATEWLSGASTGFNVSINLSSHIRARI